MAFSSQKRNIEIHAAVLLQNIEIYAVHDGTRYPIVISERATVRDLKVEIEIQRHVETEKQELYHKDRWLPEGLQLRDLAIHHGDQVILKVKIRIWIWHNKIPYKFIVNRWQTSVADLRLLFDIIYGGDIDASMLFRADGTALDDNAYLDMNGIQDEAMIYATL